LILLQKGNDKNKYGWWKQMLKITNDLKMNGLRRNWAAIKRLAGIMLFFNGQQYLNGRGL